MPQVLAWLLMADAAWIAYGLARRKNRWRWIALYWAMLTVKWMVENFGK